MPWLQRSGFRTPSGNRSPTPLDVDELTRFGAARACELDLLLLTPTLQIPANKLRSVVRIHTQKAEWQQFLDLIQRLLRRRLTLPQEARDSILPPWMSVRFRVRANFPPSECPQCAIRSILLNPGQVTPHMLNIRYDRIFCEPPLIGVNRASNGVCGGTGRNETDGSGPSLSGRVGKIYFLPVRKAAAADEDRPGHAVHRRSIWCVVWP
jgi:hypothetical protein